MESFGSIHFNKHSYIIGTCLLRKILAYLVLDEEVALGGDECFAELLVVVDDCNHERRLPVAVALVEVCAMLDEKRRYVRRSRHRRYNTNILIFHPSFNLPPL